MEPILATFWTTFGQLLESILGPKSAPEGDKNVTTFGIAFPRLSGVRGLVFQEFYERCGKAIGIGIILSKRKGGIFPIINLRCLLVYPLLVYPLLRSY